MESHVSNLCDVQNFHTILLHHLSNVIAFFSFETIQNYQQQNDSIELNMLKNSCVNSIYIVGATWNACFNNYLLALTILQPSSQFECTNRNFTDETCINRRHGNQQHVYLQVLKERQITLKLTCMVFYQYNLVQHA